MRAGWKPGALLVAAELEDDDVFTHAARAGERLWELGDVFEMFLETAAPSFYVELHVAPGNVRAQLRIPLPRPQVEPETLMTPPAFASRAWQRPGGWSVEAVVPFETIGGAPARFSFSRYDYARGRGEPVHSSTSPHKTLDFHRRHEWGTLELA